MGSIEADQAGYIERDGTRVFWEYHGRGKRDAVCLLNGLAMHTRAWYPFLQWLRPEFDVVLYDYPGQGQSSADDRPCTMPELAGYLVEIADRLSIGKLHVMGISYGGFVALDFARLYQQRLHSLILSGILLSRERLFQMYQDLSLLFYRSGEKAFEIYTHYMYEKIFGEEFVDEHWDDLDAMRQRFFDRYKDRVHSLVQLTMAQDRFLEQLEENRTGFEAIETPTLILAGEHDRVIPPHVQRKIVTILPDVRFEEIPATGHVVYIERPDPFFSTIKGFIREVRGR